MIVMKSNVVDPNLMDNYSKNNFSLSFFMCSASWACRSIFQTPDKLSNWRGETHAEKTAFYGWK